MQPFVSLCLLSYKRPQILIDCLTSLEETIDFPVEIIVNDDSATNADLLRNFFVQKKISKLILSNGLNRGVGTALQNCLGVAEGDYIIKLDTDVTFKPHWLSQTVSVLSNNPDIGALGLFDYHYQDPKDARFTPENNVISTRTDCVIVNDFVSCAYAFRKKDIPLITPVADDGNHSKFNKLGMINVVNNVSFGFGSVYVQIDPNGVATKTKTYQTPFLIG